MPELKLGDHSNAWSRVVQAFESEVGLPLGANADLAWLVQVLGIYNERNGSSIEYSHEDYGYWFRYSKPEEAMLLNELRQNYGL
jgi:hypothetical protein